MEISFDTKFHWLIMILSGMFWDLELFLMVKGLFQCKPLNKLKAEIVYKSFVIFIYNYIPVFHHF